MPCMTLPLSLTTEEADSDGYPILPAYIRDGHGYLSVWCRYCKKFHQHGQGDGHRVAHCLSDASPYRTTGYILRTVGPFTPEVSRQYWDSARNGRSEDERKANISTNSTDTMIAMTRNRHFQYL
jgi:hypothetical protein